MTAATEIKPDTVTAFTAKATEFLLMLVPDRVEHHADGTNTPIPGKWVQFEHGRFDATDDAARKVGYDDVEDLLVAMRRHAAFGGEFFEISVEPVAPGPQEALGEIARLTAAGDVAGLERLQADEEANWGRETVVQTAVAARAAIEAATAPPQE